MEYDEQLVGRMIEKVTVYDEQFEVEFNIDKLLDILQTQINFQDMKTQGFDQQLKRINMVEICKKVRYNVK